MNQESYKMSKKTAVAVIENQPSFNLENMKLCIGCPWQCWLQGSLCEERLGLPYWLQLAPVGSSWPQETHNRTQRSPSVRLVVALWKRYQEVKYLLINQKPIENKVLRIAQLAILEQSVKSMLSF